MISLQKSCGDKIPIQTTVFKSFQLQLSFGHFGLFFSSAIPMSHARMILIHPAFWSFMKMQCMWETLTI